MRGGIPFVPGRFFKRPSKYQTKTGHGEQGDADQKYEQRDHLTRSKDAG